MEEIRVIRDSDFGKISSLFNFKKSVEELKWLFSSNKIDSDSAYNGYVCFLNQEIIGVIGFNSEKYLINDKKISIVTPFSWKVREGYKGLSGIKLFRKIIEIGDVTVALGGNENSIPLFKLFSFKKIEDNKVYYKILKPIEYYKSLSDKGFKKKIKLLLYLLPSYFKKFKKSKSTIRLVDYEKISLHDKRNSKIKYEKINNENHLLWLSKCPLVDSFLLVILQENVPIGNCLLYATKDNKRKRGRIVYVSLIDSTGEIFDEVIDQCVQFLKDKKCCFISALARNNICKRGYINNGFINLKQHNTIVHIRDKQSHLSKDFIDNWHYQFAEGDDAYRNI